MGQPNRYFRHFYRFISKTVFIVAALLAVAFWGVGARLQSFFNGMGKNVQSSTMRFGMLASADLILLPDDVRNMVTSDDAPNTDLVLVERTAHLKSTFYVADPGHPNGIVEYVTVQHDGEKAVTEVFHHVLRKTNCGAQSNAVVLDIGANTGFYSMLALAEGCQRVLLFEPQPPCIRDIAHALVKNGYEDRASIIPYFVDVRSGRSVELDVATACQGRWPIGQLEDAGYKPKTTKIMETVGVVDVLRADTRIVHGKVDTEGAEYYVLLSMLPYIANGMVDSIVFEMTPMWWVHYGLSDRAAVIDQFVMLVKRYGMHCRVLEKVPWYKTELFTKENTSSLAARIDTTYQTDFWFFKPGMDHRDA